MEVHRQRPHVPPILRWCTYLSRKRSSIHPLAVGTPYLLHLMFADHHLPQRQILHLPTFDYLARYGL
jgi:hypothetical protein